MEADEISIIKVKDVLLNNIRKDLTAILTNCDDSILLKELIKNIEQFEPSPQLLDGDLRKFIEQLTERYTEILVHDEKQDKLIQIIGEIFYAFTKIRGTKTISNCLSSDIYTITPIIGRLNEKETTWQERFLLILWLSVLILSPWKLSMVSYDKDIPTEVYKISLNYLKYSGKERDAASLLMARFLARSDNTQFLNNFYEEELDLSSLDLFNQIGLLMTLNNLLKIARLSDLKIFLPQHYNLIHGQLENPNENNNEVLKLIVKGLGKICNSFILLHELERTEEIINSLVSLIDSSDTNIRYCVAKQLSKITKNLPKEFQNDIFMLLYEELEIEDLIFEDEQKINKINLNLQIDSELINIDKYHGILLTLSEFLRLKIIPENQIPIIISILHKTLFIEQHRLTHSIGSNVRDASCYISWSMVRKYNRRNKYYMQLFKDLLLVCCYDKELMIRRASCAVIQELIGRYGDFIYENFQMKINKNEFKLKIIEMLDFTVLGHLNKSFQASVTISQEISTDFKGIFTDALLVKIYSRDYQIRKIASETLRELLINQNVDEIIDDLLKSNKTKLKIGFFYALSEILPLSLNNDKYYNQILEIVSNQTFNFHKDSWYKGEEYIYIVSVMLETFPNFQLTEDIYNTIFNIIRLNNPAIIDKFILFIKNLKKEFITESFLEKLVYYIKAGNNLASSLSVGHLKELSLSNLEMFLSIVEDYKQVDCDVRSNLIDSLSVYFRNHRDNNMTFNVEILIRLVNQLDDYTVTNQGDVGSKVRMSTIRFISNNIETISINENLKKFVILKLVRLNLDIIDRLRLDSLSLFLDLCNFWHYYDEYLNSNSNTKLEQPQKALNFNDLNDYYRFLFEIYFKEILISVEKDEFYEKLALEFLKGVTFSAGGIVSSNKLINSSLLSFSYFIEKIAAENNRTYVLNQLLSLFSKDVSLSISENYEVCILNLQVNDQTYYEQLKEKNSKRVFKLVNSSLILVNRLLDMNSSLLLYCRLPAETKKLLFIRSFNLQLNQTNQTRLQEVFKIFKHLYIASITFDDGLKTFMEKGKKRMCLLLKDSKNVNLKTKKMIIQVLAELYYELLQIFKDKNDQDEVTKYDGVLKTLSSLAEDLSENYKIGDIDV
ncbi:hypothetical protein PACTADRAFT_50150 [Pachysolen tannophilus NRRL Y-2460]|uniref:Tubulin-folding cofactor D ARM repeats domain-containing protein n=1 Tax=Pachysolen tannophilus NRRL Y-2460 TaxID=669874 RepID=A0A1E4TUU5_PACTA|nr:hypothetical protein PACTADRAFT_50150 [Pachysolen tannophilus NRRL Y-2460]